MPLFRYEVVDKNGRPMIGVMDAASESEVQQCLISKGYTVNLVVPADPAAAQPKPSLQSAMTAMQAGSGPRSRVSAPPKELAVFFRSLASFLQAGITLNQALVQIASQTPNYGLRIMCERMAVRVQVGERLSDAMTEFPRAFPPHVVGVVAAGELGGFLPVMIGDVALDYEVAQRASSRTARYISWGIWMHVYGFLFTAPAFPALFSIGVMDVQTMLAKYLELTLKYVVPPLAILIIGYYVGAAILRQPDMRPVAHRLVLRVPWAGRASRERSLASFSRILWRLQSVGILPLGAWDAASRAAENLVVAVRLREQVESIRSGAKFSDALAATGLFTSEDHRVLAAAETSGQTADVLQRIGAYYEDAALVSAGRARWLGVRIATLAALFSIGVLVVCFGLYFQNMFKWVDWFMGTG